MPPIISNGSRIDPLLHPTLWEETPSTFTKTIHSDVLSSMETCTFSNPTTCANQHELGFSYLFCTSSFRMCDPGVATNHWITHSEKAHAKKVVSFSVGILIWYYTFIGYSTIWGVWVPNFWNIYIICLKCHLSSTSLSNLRALAPK